MKCHSVVNDHSISCTISFTFDFLENNWSHFSLWPILLLQWVLKCHYIVHLNKSSCHARLQQVPEKKWNILAPQRASYSVDSHRPLNYTSNSRSLSKSTINYIILPYFYHCTDILTYTCCNLFNIMNSKFTYF